MFKKKLVLGSLSAIALALFSNISIAMTPEQQGLEISKEAKQRDLGWVDSTADMLMLLRNKQGQESIREIK